MDPEATQVNAAPDKKVRSQHFRRSVPADLLKTLLEAIAIKYGDDYVLNMGAFTKGQIYGHNATFINSLRPYYYPSKEKQYLDRELTYNTFITVVRQLCKYHRVRYRYAIIYEQSNYAIHHYIRLDS